MFNKPGRLFGTGGLLAAVLLVVSIALGSSGTIEGESDTGQAIANVTFPLFVITVAVGVVLGVAYLVRRGKAR